jgi:hypothetical protein
VIGERNLRAFCRPPMGVPVSFAGVSKYSDDDSLICGLFDRPQSIDLGERNAAGMQAAKPTIRIPFNAFDPMPNSGDLITVTELRTPTDYTVDPSTAEDDGAFRVYDLFRVTDGDADEDDEQ